MESWLEQNAGLLAEMMLLALLIAVGISFVFVLAYAEVELGGLRIAWRRFQEGGRSAFRGRRETSVAVRRIP